VATGNLDLAARIPKEASTPKHLKTFLGRYFYLCMSLVFAGLVMWGFSRTVDANLIHANPPRPLLLWLHGAAFSTWVVFFIAQSSLVRMRKVSVHRFLGWFGAGLASLMVVLGSMVAVVMARFDNRVLHQPGTDAFLAVPLADMIIFGACIALAIYWRSRPEFHRRLIFIATCGLMDAAIGRFDFWFNHSIFYVGLDLLIVLGMARDWVVDGRVHKVYLYTLPPLVLLQGLAVYAWRVNPGWWQAISHAILGS
jgi:FtsH-binding integral membrane protein